MPHPTCLHVRQQVHVSIDAGALSVVMGDTPVVQGKLLRAIEPSHSTWFIRKFTQLHDVVGPG